MNFAVFLAQMANLYIFIFGFLVPFIGCVSPNILGSYLGGYRMASFHFVGNEQEYGIFVSKELLRRRVREQEAAQGRPCP